MFRALRRNALLSHGTQRWFSSTNACRLLSCHGVVAGTATQASFKPLTGLIQVEYAKSSRSNCAMCGFGIAADSLRIGTFHQGTGDFAIAAWQHPRCFRSMTLQLYPDMVRYTDDDIALKQLGSIKPADRDLVAQLLTDDDSCTWSSLLGIVFTTPLEIEMVGQQLAASALAHEALAEWTTDDLVTLSSANISPQEAAKRAASKKKPDRDVLIGTVSSQLLFGPIAPCEACNGGELVPNEAQGVYKCKGHFDAFTRCGTIVSASDIRRTTLNVPSSVDGAVKDLRKKLTKELPFDKQVIVGHVVKLAAANWREQHGRSLGDGVNVKTYRDLTFFTNKTSLQDKSIDWGAVTARGGVVTEKREPVQGEFKQDGSEHYVKTTKSDSKSSSIDRSLPIVSTEWVQESTKVLRPLTAIEGFTYYEDDRRPPAVDSRWLQSLAVRSGTAASPDSTTASSVPSPTTTTATTTESATSTTVVFCGSAPVDAESNLAGTHSVYHTNDLPWSATLSLVDLSTDKNTFYILQLLQANESSSQKKFVVFRRWGRLGDPLKSGATEEAFWSADRAKSKFAKYFQDRTDNEWEPLTADHARQFVKKPGKYSWVDPPLADGDEDTYKSKEGAAKKKLDSAALTASSTQKPAALSLPRETEKLMELLFDEESIQRSMATMNIDTKKMPLPGLNARAVKEGRAVLQQLMKENISISPPSAALPPEEAVPAAPELIDTTTTKKSTKKLKEPSKKKKQQAAELAAQEAAAAVAAAAVARSAPTETPAPPPLSPAEEQRRQRNILSLSNQFYSHIPHVRTESAESFLLNTTDKIASKFQLLDDLEDILITKKMMLQKTGDHSGNQRLVSHYQALHIDLQPLSTATEEGKMVATYFNNSHGATHRRFKLRQLWKLEREGEEQRFEPWKTFPNRKLLWHGSRLTNWVRILTTGLKIAPPDAPVSGYMFGKGIYFADMISKSANYCNMDSSSGDGGLLILAEVALGTPTKRYQSDYITSLPKNTHSTYALGKSMPDPNGDLTLPTGLVVPTGKPVDQPDGYRKCSLMYNEFIVYDVTQVKLKYLLHVDS
ncbi:poly (ADP ribose) polymerase, putative [Bodo saltans]|uniref:Poly [ADP-ribose] polymerase n=1 Tax=Bodo saltans TaxID=75058 RepID=A0A0S4IQW6_BODSA|nr:poly (ADP ribose) polymerase, putative [Bodo saltans]|eukprot:CUF30512.1 poly (ADP ribose) polymerase, putative [Bodo saltans]